MLMRTARYRHAPTCQQFSDDRRHTPALVSPRAADRAPRNEGNAMPLFNDFGFTDEQKLMRQSLLALAEQHLPAEKIRQIDRDAGWPTEAYQAMAKGGWLGLPYPEEYGGLGGSYKDMAILLETLSYHYACLGTTYMTSVIYAGLQLLYNGSDHLKQTYMVPMIKGDIYLAFALTEPQTGSDAA